ncbi:MAG: flagellar basal body rod protein FlgC [Planctomycetota bacterium]|nr:flagellar basal body rod protein FlgC [Planctomycetota bacterium]
MLKSIDISTSGLVAQRHRMDTIAGNIAHLNTTRDENGNPSPFMRRLVHFQTNDDPMSSTEGGVAFQVEIDTDTPPRLVHQPGHPDANAEGYVAYPNIDLMTEYTNAMLAARAYEANITAIEMTKQMGELGMQILA